MEVFEKLHGIKFLYNNEDKCNGECFYRNKRQKCKKCGSILAMEIAYTSTLDRYFSILKLAKKNNFFPYVNGSFFRRSILEQLKTHIKSKIRTILDDLIEKNYQYREILKKEERRRL